MTMIRANYAFDIISKTGDSISRGESTGSLGELGNSPSINDLGSVAFIGKFGTGFRGISFLAHHLKPNKNNKFNFM